ncbi:MAG TPA: hypothetical protein VME41_11350 [Stellaceae bacterium]|nr:hypothetical protein [Stellaceae bacterium]
MATAGAAALKTGSLAPAGHRNAHPPAVPTATKTAPIAAMRKAILRPADGGFDDLGRSAGATPNASASASSASESSCWTGLPACGGILLTSSSPESFARSIAPT